MNLMLTEDALRQIAERVAKLLAETAASALPVTQASAGAVAAAQVHMPPLSPFAEHPSIRQFGVNEAIGTAPSGELLEFAAAPPCSIEQSKPCDHCGSCRVLGF